MVSPYEGHFLFNEDSIFENVPESIGVYYCGEINNNNKLLVYYVGMSGESIKNRLLDHLRDEDWSDVTHFGYELCSTKQEALDHEVVKIEHIQPKYNDQGK